MSEVLNAKTGFTLAEVLITLVIIGVIASMTIPSAINAKNDKETIARLKKSYSVLSQIATTSRAYNGDFTVWTMQDNNTSSVEEVFKTYIQPYIRTTKVCIDENGCWSDNITKDFSGTSNASTATTKGIGSNLVTFVMSDGTSVSMDIYGGNIDSVFGVLDNVFYPTLTFFVDLNGNKGPNQIGKDVFAFVLTETGIVPAGKDNGASRCYNGASGGYSGFDCSSKVLKTGTTQY